MNFYGEAPVEVGRVLLPEWQEFMHYMYLPVVIPHHEWSGKGSWDRIPRLPERLEFLRPSVLAAIENSADFPHLHDPYVYVTARRDYATPGNPLNRPGWHCDDFGGTDLNYVWTDAFPTLSLLARQPLLISEDDAESMRDMEHHAAQARENVNPTALHGYETNVFHCQRIVPMEINTLYRLSPFVIHSAPEIPEPGGMRSFFKISVSTHRYDLIGNSHNYLHNYDWPMFSREEMRNKPQGGDKDYSS